MKRNQVTWKWYGLTLKNWKNIETLLWVSDHRVWTWMTTSVIDAPGFWNILLTSILRGDFHDLSMTPFWTNAPVFDLVFICFVWYGLVCHSRSIQADVNWKENSECLMKCVSRFLPTSQKSDFQLCYFGQFKKSFWVQPWPRITNRPSQTIPYQTKAF